MNQQSQTKISNSEYDNLIKDSLKNWKFDYEERESLTNKESLVIKISNLQKKNG